MARRVLIVPTLISVAFSIALFLEATVFAASATSVAEFNVRFVGTPPVATPNESLTITVPDGVWREWRNTDAINGGITGVNTTLTVTKEGAGIWRLGEGTPLIDPLTGLPLVDPVTGAPVYMTNTLIAGTSANTFDVNAGILDLMLGTRVLMTTGSATSSFIVATGTSVNARGANVIALPTTLAATADGMVLRDNSTLGFDLTDYMDMRRPSDYPTDTSDVKLPVLTIAGNVTKPAASDQVNINLLGFADIDSNSYPGEEVTLLRYNYNATTYTIPPIYAGNHLDPNNVNSNIYANRRLDPTFTPNPADRSNLFLQVRGQDWDAVVATGRLSGVLRQEPPLTIGTGVVTTSLVLTDVYSALGTVTWTGATDNVWNATLSNWTGNVDSTTVTTFLHGDSVVFGSGGLRQDVVVQEGGVQIGSVLAAGTPPGFGAGNYGMLVNGGNYFFENEGNSTIGIDGRGKVIVDGQSTFLTFRSANSYWGGTDIRNNGTLIVENACALGTGAVQMYTGGTLIFDILQDPAFVLNHIGGEEGTTIIKEGIGTVHLDGTVTSRGDTEVREGTLVNNIASGVLTVYYGATYDGNNQNRAVAGLSDGPAGEQVNGEVFPDPNGGSIVMGTGDLFLNVVPGKLPTYISEYPGSTNGYLSFSGTIDGTGKLVKDGTGDQILTENPVNVADGIFSTYSGGTDVNMGKLVVQHVLDNHRQIQTLGTGTVTIAAAGTLQFDIAGDVNAWVTGEPTELVAMFVNQISGMGTVLKMAYPERDSPRSNAAVLHLTANNSDYTGLTDVREGTLRLGSVNATGKTVEVRLAADTVLQFDMDDSTAMVPYDRIITGAGSVEVLTAPAFERIVYVSGTNDDQPSTASNYTGTTTVMDDVTLHLLNAEGTGRTSQVNLTTDWSNLVLDFTQDQTYDRYVTGDGNLRKTGVGVATLDYDPDKPMNVPNDYLGTTTVENGTLRLLYGQATGADDAPDVQSVEVRGLGILELAFDGDYNKGIWGTGAVAKSGSETVTTLRGLSTYEGGTYIYGTKNADGTFSLGGTLSFNDTTLQAGNLGQGGVYFRRGGGTLQNTGPNPTFDQKIVIDAGSIAIFETLDDMTILGSNGISHRTLDPADPDYNAADLRSHLEKRGGADLTILTAAGWTGRTIVHEGRLIGNITQDTELTVNILGEYHAGNDHRQVSLLLGEGIVQTTQGFDFIVNNAVENIFDGSVKGDGNLVKSEQGLFVLSGSENSYTGKTVVREGTLRGNIAARAALVVEGKGTYEAGWTDRSVRSLEGSGIVDMQNRSLAVNMEGGETTTAVFNGQILHGRLFQKYGTGTQVLGGKFYEFHDDVRVSEGTLQIGANSTATSVFRTAGNLTVLADGTFAVNPLAQVDITKKLTIDGTFSVAVGNNVVHANEVELGLESTINITGITSASETRTVIRSDNDIVGQFQYVTVAGNPSTDVDFLIFGVSYDDPKAVKVGQSLRWYDGKDAHGTFTLNNVDGVYDVGISLRDITDASRRLPTWDGATLTKRGLGTLVLSTSNTYTGETRVEGGTLKLTHAEATLGSSRIILGSETLPNVGALELDFNGSMSTTITGTGSGVYKTGDSITVLDGRYYHTAPTEVKQGTLYLDGSLMSSSVWVDAGAGFGGNGKVFESVSFRDGAFFDWRFGKSEEESDLLTASRVNIGNGVRVRPNTSLQEQATITNFNGWKILRYEEPLNNHFVGVENGANPYYDFELDYSEFGFVKINGFLRAEPRALSDIVATTLVTAQTKMYRSVYQQIAREWASDCPDHPATGRHVSGQARRDYRAAWMNFVGRGDQYASNYFGEKYQFQSYGAQVGLSLFSNCQNSFGIMYGREESKLGNFSDEVRGEDNYLGLYYGHAFATGIDFRGYIGGGWQSNRLKRRSNGNLYHANYNGNTFNLDFEFGRRFLTERLWELRPFLGFDLAVARIGSATETTEANPTANEYRAYERASFTQFLTRVGFELGKGWRMFDFNTGMHLAWNWAETDPSAMIRYPVTGGAVRGRAADIGRFDLVMNVGFNWYITQQRNTMFFVNYVGDIYLDRQGQTGNNTGVVGFGWRF